MTMARSQLRHQANIASAKQPTNSQQISFELVGGVFFQRTARWGWRALSATGHTGSMTTMHNAALTERGDEK